jgi:hypothetical protein
MSFEAWLFLRFHCIWNVMYMCSACVLYSSYANNLVDKRLLLLQYFSITLRLRVATWKRCCVLIRNVVGAKCRQIFLVRHSTVKSAIRQSYWLSVIISENDTKPFSCQWCGRIRSILYFLLLCLLISILRCYLSFLWNLFVTAFVFHGNISTQFDVGECVRLSFIYCDECYLQNITTNRIRSEFHLVWS